VELTERGWAGIEAGTGGGGDNWDLGRVGTVAYFGVNGNGGDGNGVSGRS